MKILLINDNPVVNKLVTLSAQKTSDELEVVSSVDAVAATRYNLVVIDDTLYTDEMFAALNEKIKFDKSLYVCSRDAKEIDGFDEILKKPFLPTDLVEIFIKIGNSASDLDAMDDFTSLDEETQAKSEEISLPNEEDSSDDEILDLENIDNFELDDLNDNDISLDDALEDLDEDNISLDDETLGESVLDDEEAQKVKDLLDETEELQDEDLNLDDLEDDEVLNEDFKSHEIESEIQSEENDLEDDLDLDISEDTEIDNDVLEDNLELENDIVSGEELEDNLDLEDDVENEDDVDLEEELKNELDLEDELDLDMSEDTQEDVDSEDDVVSKEALEKSIDLEDELDFDMSGDEEDNPEINDADDDAPTTTEEKLEDVDLESQIQSAVNELSDEDLDSEVDEETLLGIVSGDLDSLTSRDLKLAVGENIESNPETDVEEVSDSDALVVEDDNSENVEGVEALKTLLTALTDKKVAASMKGMKISINITLGDQ